MRGIIGWTAALLVMGLGVGCSAGATGTTSELYVVDSSSLAASEALFLDESLDSRPLTQAQMVSLYGELSPNAVPVEVEVLDHVAVAWLREDGITSRTRADLVAAWRVEGRYEGATPVDGELDHSPGGPIYVPGGGLDLSNVPDLNTGTDLTGNAHIVIDFTNGLDTAIFTQPDVWNDFNTAHPGCA